MKQAASIINKLGIMTALEVAEYLDISLFCAIAYCNEAAVCGMVRMGDNCTYYSLN